MHLFEAIILGLVQGLTEFLPISSSAHLRILGEFLPSAEDPGAAFTAITQLGTEAAFVLFFWRDIWRIGSTWAIRDCSLAIPAGSVTALVGPNGAGKTTLLHLAIGLLEPSTGVVRVLGWSAREHSELVLPRVGFVAQDHPLYRGFTLSEMLRFGRELNPRWDDDLARERLAALGIPLERKVGKLSGGQQAQVALTLALAKRPEPKSQEAAGLVFVTKYGQGWAKDTTTSPVSHETRKLLNTLGINGSRNFYTLRHVFRTIAD